MDLDPNYDPSDFLPTGSRTFESGEKRSQSSASAKIQDDLAISDSDEDNVSDDIKTKDDLGELWF